MGIVTSAFAALLVSVIFYGTSAEAQRSPVPDDKAARIALVREFVREVQLLYRLQEISKKEFAENPSANAKMMTSIRMGTRISLEMNDSINRLNISPSLDDGPSFGIFSRNSTKSERHWCKR
jgi:hypothetical protein